MTKAGRMENTTMLTSMTKRMNEVPHLGWRVVNFLTVFASSFFPAHSSGWSCALPRDTGKGL